MLGLEVLNNCVVWYILSWFLILKPEFLNKEYGNTSSLVLAFTVVRCYLMGFEGYIPKVLIVGDLMALLRHIFLCQDKIFGFLVYL